ncbi:response regulator transcription factor [Leifsonia sp. NPDC058194]|uniref:response regulator transcription factor n=1 Tax=Leifsonia sp. NPDC058194 TaxID=3346374 RepID=UPI0036DC7416
MGELLANELIWDAQPGVSRQDYFVAALEALAQAFPCDSLGWNNLDFETDQGTTIGRPAEVFGAQTATAVETMMHVTDHPMIVSYFQRPDVRSPRRMSDVVTETELHRTDAYNLLLHPYESEFQFTILTGSQGTRTGSCWTFNRRTRDFSDEDLQLATRIQPLLVLIERTWGLNEVARAVESDLTAREVSVLRLLANGLTARAIGARLGISASTVNKHLEHIYRKLNTGDRLIAVERARRLGLVAAPAAPPPVGVPS